jgi:hypothetical protein
MSIQGRWTRIVGCVLTVAALGLWGCSSARGREAKARIIVVKVNARLLDSTEPIAISKSRHQEIVWRLPPGSSFTNVAIDLAGKPNPFVACETSEGVCHIPCEHRSCPSGAINPSLTVPPPVLYEYSLAGPSAASSDPGIRIDP